MAEQVRTEPVVGEARKVSVYPGEPEVKEVFVGWRLCVPMYAHEGSSFSVPHGDVFITRDAADDAAEALRARGMYRFVGVDEVWKR